MVHSGFLQETYLHFHSRAMPGWTDNDSLLAQRVDGMLAIAQACQGDPIYAKFLEEIQLRHITPPSQVVQPQSSLLAGDFQDSLPLESVYMRVLHPIWSDAMAAGLKLAETQRYMKNWGNAMKFAAQDTMLAFGTSDFLQGLAILSGPAVTKCTSDDLPVLLALVNAEYHPALLSYLEGCKCFDYVHAARLVDLRHMRLEWSAVWQQFPAREPKTRQGFPKIGGMQLYLKLMQFATHPA